VIFNFAAIGEKITENQAGFLGESGAAVRPPASLAELIAEEKRAWQGADEGEQANAVTDRLCAYIPTTAAEAAMQIEWLMEQPEGTTEPELLKSLAAGLRAIAATTVPNTDAEPEILRLFREWRQLWRTGEAIADTDEFEHLCEVREALELRIFDAPAADARGLAVKVFMSAQLELCGACSDDGEPVLDGFGRANYSADSGTLYLEKRALKGLVESLPEFLPEVEPLCRAIVAAPKRLPTAEVATAGEEGV